MSPHRFPVFPSRAALVAFGLLSALASSCTRADSCPVPRAPRLALAEDPAVALEEVVHEHRSLYSLVEPDAGLAIVLNRTDPSGEDPNADTEGRIRAAERVCSAEAPSLARVEQALALHYEPEYDYVPVRCEGLVCEARGPMEFATSLRFVFERSSQGGIVLRTVLEVEDVGMIDEFVHQAWNWAELAAAQLPPRCEGH